MGPITFSSLISARPVRFGQQPSSPPAAPDAGADTVTIQGSPQANLDALFTQFKLPGIGGKTVVSKDFTPENIRQFCELTGDFNPIHLDPKAAKASGFEERVIAQGAFVSSQIPTAIVQLFPGHFPIYGAQNSKFLAPVYAGDRTETELTVKDAVYKEGRKPGTGSFTYTVSTMVYKLNPEDGSRIPVIEGQGQAVIRVKSAG